MRFTVAVAVAALGLIAGAPALAGTKPLYAPAPAWVIAAPPVGTAASADDSQILILDQQQRLQDGAVWAYIDSANRITSEQALAQAGTVSLQWQPDNGDLIVHRIAILRGTETIDLLAAPEPLTVLRRERGLEQLQLDGMLTATMPVQGLRIGDVLRVSYSVTRSDPVLKGAMQSSAFLIADPARANFARARLLWKAADDVRWKALADVKNPKLSTANGYRELTIALPLPKAPDLPGDAPARFRPLPVVEVSSFADWNAVSTLMAPLYRTSGTITLGTPLAAEVARIKAASADPKTRAALALRAVQSDVRYLFSGLDHGNYVPQAPEKTWAVRYGDCKAKTLLLLSLLDALGIEAEPVLAHTQLGDYLPKRLPAAAAFNHVLVRATIGGTSYWLDGTATGTRLADLGDTPAFHYVLPVRGGGATLLPVVTHANARPNYEVAEDVDQTAGIGITAPFAATITVRGGQAEQLKAAAAQATPEKKKELVDGLIGRMVRPATVVTRSIDYDAETATAVIHATGLTDGDWVRDDQRYEWRLDKYIAEFKFGGDRARPEWRDIPVATGGVATLTRSVRLHLPDAGRGFALDGDESFDADIAGEHVHRTVTSVKGVIALDDRIDETGAEIAPAAVAETRARLALAQSRLLKVTAPRDYPQRWLVIAAAARGGRFKPIEAAYAKAIADAAEKPPAYLARAAFRESVYDRKGAIADLDQVIANRPDVSSYLDRASLLREVRSDARALGDAKAAFALDPGSTATVGALTLLEAEQGQLDAALALLDARIAAGGEQKTRLQATKADILARAGQAEPALAAIDAAIAAKPGDASLLNARCWLKATLGVKLDTALKDCTKSIELGDSPVAALDSRALVYFKLGRLDDALADLNAALDQRPELAASLYMRGVIRRKQGAAATGDADLEGARFIAPRIDDDYRRYGVKLS